MNPIFAILFHYLLITEWGRKTIKLISDINLGDAEANNNESIVFYPIGYYNNTEDYVKASGNNFTFKDDRTSVYSTVKSFSGTFDGNNHAIKTIQNTAMTWN